MHDGVGGHVDASYLANDLHYLLHEGPNLLLVLERVDHHDVLAGADLITDRGGLHLEPFLCFEFRVDGLHDHGHALVEDGVQHAYDGDVLDAQFLEGVHARPAHKPVVQADVLLRR